MNAVCPHLIKPYAAGEYENLRISDGRWTVVTARGDTVEAKPYLRQADRIDDVRFHLLRALHHGFDSVLGRVIVTERLFLESGNRRTRRGPVVNAPATRVTLPGIPVALPHPANHQ